MTKKSATTDQRERNARRKHSSHAGSRPADAHAAAHAHYNSKSGSVVHHEDVSPVVKQKKKKKLVIPPILPSKLPGYKKGPRKSFASGIPNAGQKCVMIHKYQTMNAKRVSHWKEWVSEPSNVARITVDVDLNELRKIGQGDRMTFEAALVVKDELEDVSFPARSVSGLWVDRHGTPMVAYFGDGHGVPDRIICDKHYETQKLFVLQPKLLQGLTTDQRHGDDFKDQEFVYVKEGEEFRETKGLRHDCEAWQEQGRPNATLVPSADLMGSTNGSNSARRHIQTAAIVYADEELTDFLTQCVKAAFPEKYAALSSSARAGRWVGTSVDSAPDHGGIFLGRATLWKLQTFLHVDGKDFLCVILSSGKYTGGEALFPDLWLKLKYSPGHVIAFQSEALYHATAKWKALPMAKEDIFTPGKVTWVYFSPTNVVKRLQDKESNWFLQTAGGII